MLTAHAHGQDPLQVRAVISTDNRFVTIGKPVWIDFSLQNLSSETVTLTVPDTDPGPCKTAMGLPLSHVFSGRAFGGLTIAGDLGRRWDVAVEYQPPNRTEVVEIAPFGSVGISLDAATYYPMLRNPGRYQLSWEPYSGALRSNVLKLEVAPRKQVTLLTDQGEMTVELFYEEAPNHVANFLELCQEGFYDNLTFHRIWPGTFMQGGCPRGDGTGIRADGRKLEAEFNDHPQDRGAVSMALARSEDPDSASCQFFIVNTRIAEWDGRFTVFGHLIGDHSYQTLDKLMAVEVDEQGRPRKRAYIRGVRIEDMRSQDQSLMLQNPLTGPNP